MMVRVLGGSSNEVELYQGGHCMNEYRVFILFTALSAKLTFYPHPLYQTPTPQPTSSLNHSSSSSSSSSSIPSAAVILNVGS